MRTLNAFSRFIRPIFPLIGAALLITGATFAGEQCSNPKPGYPALSFGMTSIGGNACKTQLDRARWLGFTSVTLSPAFYLNSDGSVDATEKPGVLEACLTYAKDRGFDIVYKPMIEARPDADSVKAESSSAPATTLADRLLRTPNPVNAPWRAKFDFRPGNDYEQKVIEPFLTWMESSQVKGTSLKASIVVATELHRSIVDYSKDWNALMWNTRKKLETDGLRAQVQIGMDPSAFGGHEWWLPSEIRRTLSKSDCEQYQAMLWTSDFYSSSMYGD